MAFTERHVLVKFSSAADSPVSRRWRDLLAAEHIAAQVLLAKNIPASRSRLFDIGKRRFLEVERFDREGHSGRRALHSLSSVEAEFIGDASSPWPLLTAKLAAQGTITAGAAASASLLYAFGTLIGNSDMHNGNLSFLSENGRPYRLAPAYDMLPMAFAPRSGGSLPDGLPPARLHPGVQPEAWRHALLLAEEFISAIKADARFSESWAPCRDALVQHVQEAREKIARLGRAQSTLIKINLIKPQQG